MTAADARRRLLADVRAARGWFDQECHEAGCNTPACKCCLECWLHEMTKCPPDVTHGLRDLDAEDLDYLERLALDGLAGEDNPHAWDCERTTHPPTDEDQP